MGNGSWSARYSGKAALKGESHRQLGRAGLAAALLLALAAAAVLSLSSRFHSPLVSAHAQNWQTPSFLQLSAPTSRKSANFISAKVSAQSALQSLPLVFEPNQGQAEARVKFISRGAGYALALDESGARIALPKAYSSRAKNQIIGMKLVGAKAKAPIAGSNLLPGKSNYFLGNDPSQWHSGIPQFASVQYKQVYPGIDLVFYGNQGRLEYDFRVAPGADPSRAELQFVGPSNLRLQGGDLMVAGVEGQPPLLRLRAPQIYQLDGERRRPIKGHFLLHADNRVSFEIGSYNRSRELVIDPALDFSSYFGIINAGTPASVAVNNDGNIYLSGSTTATTGFPASPSTTSLGTAPHIFVAKISPTSPPSLVYLTFLGGSGSDTGIGLGVDLGGNPYVAGNTTSTNFPTTSLSYQSAPLGKTQCTAGSASCTSLFVSALNAAGTALTYSSYVSGNGDDVATGMAIDTSKDVFITGTTTSNNAASFSEAFPATLLPVPFQSSALSSPQFFVTKVNTTVPGTGGIAYSTYFGATAVPGGTTAVGGGVAVDSNGNIYFSGTTNFYNSGTGLFGNTGTSGDFPILNSYQPCLDTVPPLALSSSNPCTAPGTTPYPTDAFLAKINPFAQTGAQLIWSSYLGGANADTSTSIAIDPGATNVYLTGSTNSTNFLLPTGTIGFQSCLNNPAGVAGSCPATTANTDAYVARFANPAASTSNTPSFVTLDYFSYLGGGGNEVGNAIAVDTASDALVTGFTTSGTGAPGFPVTTGAIQSTLNGTQNAFFAHISTTTTALTPVGNYATYFGGNGVDSGTSIAVDQNLNTYFAGSTTSTANLEVADALQSAFNTPGPDAFVVKLGTASDLCITCVAPFISPSGIVSAGNPVTITLNISNNGPDVATGVNVTGQVPTGVTFTSASVGSGTCSAPTGNTGSPGTIVTCQIPTLQAGGTSVITFVVTPLNAGTFELTATASNPNNTNTNTTATASFTASGYTISVAPSAQTVAAGQTGKYSVIVAPTQGVFGANVALSCSTLPAGASCNFSNSSVNLSNGAGTASSVLTVTTTAQPVATASLERRGPTFAFWLAVPGLALFGAGVGGKKRRGAWLLSVIALGAFFALTLMQPACSNGVTQPTVSGTPSGTYTVNLTATSGSFTQTAPFTLTVIP